MILDKFVVSVEGPLENGENCIKRFEQGGVKQNAGTLGPLLFRLTKREYPGWGLRVEELRIVNAWGVNLLLHELSAELSKSPAGYALDKNNGWRINVKNGGNSVIFFPPHYWNDGYFSADGESPKVILFKAEGRLKPLPLFPGNERVFLVLQALESAGRESGKLFQYLENEVFRRIPEHKVMISHLHTKYSDGHGTLSEQAGVLKKAGADIGLWTDHDIHIELEGPSLERLDQEVQLASDENFLAISRPELSPNFRKIPELEGKLAGHGCYLTPRHSIHLSCMKRNGRLFAGEGALDIVSRIIAEKGNGISWLAHPALSRMPEELISAWNRHISMMEWSNHEWVMCRARSSLFRYCENFGQLFFEKLDMLLNRGFDPGIIAGVDFHRVEDAGYVYHNGIANYLENVKLDAASVVECLRERRFFVSTGEVAPVESKLQGSTVFLNIDSVFPLENVVIATDKGKKIYSSLNPEAGKEIRLELGELTPEKWWRAEIWDAANNPAFIQPVVIR